MSDTAHLTIRMKTGALGGWNLLLQKGFYKTGPGGLTVREFVMKVLGYESEYIDKTVRTIFLNYSPVDNIDEAVVHDGDKLSLGSAMPGLVGIVMGRDNPFKSFREGITCHDSGLGPDKEETIRVFLKVFSVLAVDTGADILACGIETTVGDVRTLIKNYKDHLIEADGLDGLGAGDIVSVSVEFVE